MLAARVARVKTFLFICISGYVGCYRIWHRQSLREQCVRASTIVRCLPSLTSDFLTRCETCPYVRSKTNSYRKRMNHNGVDVNKLRKFSQIENGYTPLFNQ